MHAGLRLTEVREMSLDDVDLCCEWLDAVETAQAGASSKGNVEVMD